MTNVERELIELIRDSKNPAKAAEIALAALKEFIMQLTQ